MVVFGVIALVAQHSVRVEMGGRLAHGGGKLGRILAGARPTTAPAIQ
jgi:hypothetical protein